LQVAKEETTYDSLRRMALSAVSHGLTAPGPDHPEVSGVVVDIPMRGAFATFVALTDGTISMYMSTGGGTIGAGTHAEVSAAARGLLAAIQKDLDLFTLPVNNNFPPAGVRFHVLSADRPRTEDLPEDVFWGRREHPLNAVIAATHYVITVVRQVAG
jgi:hypothetical protein